MQMNQPQHSFCGAKHTHFPRSLCTYGDTPVRHVFSKKDNGCPTDDEPLTFWSAGLKTRKSSRFYLTGCAQQEYHTYNASPRGKPKHNQPETCQAHMIETHLWVRASFHGSTSPIKPGCAGGASITQPYPEKKKKNAREKSRKLRPKDW